MSDEKPFYIVMAQQMQIIDARGLNVKTVRFRPPDAEPIEIVKYVKTFGWYNPIFRQYQVFEHKSGVMIGQGHTQQEARRDCHNFFQTCNEDMFFKQAEAMGEAMKHPEISYDEAINSYVALLKQHAKNKRN